MAITLYKPDDPKFGHTLVSCDKCGNDLEKSVSCECYKEHGYAISYYDNVQVRVKSHVASG